MTRWERLERTLRHGVYLLLWHPEFDRDCSDCTKWLYDEAGNIIRRPRLTGPPTPRPLTVPTPCASCPKIPLGRLTIRENALELTPQLRQAYLFFLECRAVNHWPDDPIVRWAARICRDVHDRWDRVPLLRLAARLGVDLNAR